jgi:hypothetical protein
MGLDTKRPPLPAPTDISSADQNSAVGISDFATDISTRTDKTSYSIPEDGSPVTITTKKLRAERDQSQTSLLIEYFEAGKSGDKLHSRPSVRVRVTPSSSRKSRKAHDHIQITETTNRKPSYTRRISLPGRKSQEVIEGTELSSQSDSSSGRPPVEVEVLQHSELSGSELSATRFVPLPSDISSIPPDSLVDAGSAFRGLRKKRSQSLDRGLESNATAAATGAAEAVVMDTLKAPSRRRSRSTSRERIAQMAVEKVQRQKESTSRSRAKGKDVGSRSRSISKEYVIDEEATSKRRSSKQDDDQYLREPSSLQPSEVSAISRKSDRSMRSTTSTASINNPKLLGIVEDTIKRLILPELNALKEEQHIQKNRIKYDETIRDSRAPVGSREDLRRLSKTSSLPSVKPSIHADDRGLIHSSESVRSRKSRRSSRGSTSDRSLETAVRDESSHSRRKSSGERRTHSKDHSKDHLKEAAVAGGLLGAAAGLTARNLKHHDSLSSLDEKQRERRKKRSKSRSRSASIADSVEDTSKRESIPPLPMQSTMESDVTRDSILSADTERPASRGSVTELTPVRELREVARGSPRHVISPAPQTPIRDLTPVSAYHGHRSPAEARSPASDRGVSKAKAAGLAAAGLAAGTALAAATRDHKGRGTPEKRLYEPATPTRSLSPVQSDASFHQDRREFLQHDRVRSIRSGESLGSPKKTRSARSSLSNHSVPISPNAFDTKKRPQGISLEKAYEIMPEEEYVAETPVQSDVEDWLEREHEENEQYRSEISQLEPSELEQSRISGYTEASATDEYREHPGNERGVQTVSANPEYVQTPLAVESAVASLLNPSTISVHSSPKNSGLSGKEAQAPVLEREVMRENTIQGIGVHRQATSKERWEQIRDRAIASSNKYQEGGVIEGSPHRGEARSMELIPKMGASAIPQPGDEMPEIGHGLDDESEMTTNPSIIQGPIGGLDHDDRSHWPYDETPDPSAAQDREIHHGGHDAALLGTAAATAGAAIGLGVATARSKDQPTQPRYESPSREYQPRVEDEYESATREVDAAQEPYPQQMYTPSPAHLKDEGYQSAAQPGGISPEPFGGTRDIDETRFDRYGDDLDVEDPFMTQKHLRHESGLSHGMSSPLYDAATGKGIDRIQSRDIVALMDHLTVRDAQRNARDTEILVTLVRSAAEMRNSFEEVKRFIAEQDKMIMHNMDRDADMTVQRILGGPRPLPTRASPRTATARSQVSEEEDVPQKRRNILKRALKGLGSRNSNELAKIESMLMQLLNEVEGLKDGQSIARAPNSQTGGSINSYENMRNNPDSGYEPEGRAGTSSTPNQSGYLSNPSSRHLNGTMHSGFERRGSEGHRISTVLEEDFEDHQHPQASPRVSRDSTRDSRREVSYDEERMLTPTQEVQQRSAMPLETPPEQTAARFQGQNSMSIDDTPQSGKSRKHKSNASSIFSGFPRISRWSKTTASTIPESAPPSAGRKDGRAMSAASRSGSNLDVTEGYDDNYELNEDDRIRSSNSLPRGMQARSPSPLIPENGDEMDDPKYQAHRNSLNLQHPQPRPGPTHRHQTYLESQAIDFEQPPTPDADQWGSAPALAINRNRFSGTSTQTGGNLSPVYSDGGYSAHSASEQAQAPPRPPKVRDDGPLVPPKEPIPSSSTWETRTVATTTAGGTHTFPYGSPMLNPDVHIPSPLEPIQEVRYSLETDRNSMRQQMTPSPRPTAMQSMSRKITGPREMPPSTRTPSGGAFTGGVKRKPVGSGNQQVKNPSPGKLTRWGGDWEKRRANI